MASRGLNKVLLIGNLGADPETRYTPNGKAVTTFRIAVNRNRKDQATGTFKEETEWINIVTWEQLAETCARYLTKGKQVFIEGRLQTRSWDAQDGTKRYMTEVVASEMIMLGGGGGAGAGAAPREAQLDAGDTMEPPLGEEELPF